MEYWHHSAPCLWTFRREATPLLLILASKPNPTVQKVMTTHIFHEQLLKAREQVSLAYREKLFTKLVDTLRNRLSDVLIMTAHLSYNDLLRMLMMRSKVSTLYWFNHYFHLFSDDAFIFIFLDIPVFWHLCLIFFNFYAKIILHRLNQTAFSLVISLFQWMFTF